MVFRHHLSLKKLTNLAGHVFELKALTLKVRHESLFGNRAKCACAQANADPAVFFWNEDTLVLQVRELAHFGFIVSVGNIVSDERTFF